MKANENLIAEAVDFCRMVISEGDREGDNILLSDEFESQYRSPWLAMLAALGYLRLKGYAKYGGFPQKNPNVRLYALDGKDARRLENDILLAEKNREEWLKELERQSLNEEARRLREGQEELARIEARLRELE